jgi:23S rRNA pseudouridine1911/1915/1917 synthase
MPAGMADDTSITGTLTQSGRIDKVLADGTDLSRERVKALLAEGRVVIDGVPATSPSAKVAAGAAYVIHIPPPEDPQAHPQDIPIVVVFEDEHLIVVDKAAGMVVHPAAGNADGTLVNALLHHCMGQLAGIGGVARPGIVHRIDKDTSGLLVVAKSDKAHEGLARQFADHSLERAYLAVCIGYPQPPSGTIAKRLGRSDADRKKMAVLADDASRGKHAVTHFRTLQRLDGCTLIECRLETGRTHQVRVHLASIGHSLVGDPVYGRSTAQIRTVLKDLGFERQALHAAVLGFVHPVTGEKLRFESEMPADMKRLIDETAYSNR